MKKLTGIILLAGLLASCELVDVVDVEPQDILNEETAIRNQETAELALAGIYKLMNDAALTVNYKQIVMQIGIEAEPGGFIGSGSSSNYYTNNIDVRDENVVAVYSRMYEVINRANYLIEKLPQLDDSLFEGTRKSEIMAEARFMRGLYHFYLLRLFGQFWDMDSEYGIVLKKEPSRSAEPIPRSTVQQSYEFILDEMDFAIQNLPPDNPAFYANPYAAKGFKARILLYMEEFDDAALVAKDVIDNSPYALEPTYGDIFENGYASQEMLFATYHDGDEFSPSGTVWFNFISISSTYKQIAHDLADTRVDTVDYLDFRFGPINGKLRNPTMDEDNFHLRLAEIYLIYAEALARSGGTLTDPDSDVDDVEDAINVIRNRVDMPNTTAVTREEFITAVREEKLLELIGEEGEPWYDMVRYADLDGLNLTSLKSTLVHERQYILPIPYSSVNASREVVKQNPGYKIVTAEE